MKHKHWFTRIFSTLVIAVALLGVQPALASPLAQEDSAAAVGIYVGLVPTDDGTEQQATIYLIDGGVAGLTIDGEGDDAPNVYSGTWELADDVVTITVVGDQDRTYTEPFIFALVFEDDTLTVTHEQFGPDSVTFYLVKDAEALAAFEENVAEAGVGGIYASDGMPYEDGATIVMLVYLMDDGSAELIANYFGALILPLVETGTWMTNEDGTVTLTLTERVEIGEDGPALVELDKPAESTFTVGPDGELITDEFVLYPVEEAASEVIGETEKVAFAAVVAATDEAPLRAYVVLFTANGGAGLVTTIADEENLVEFGIWEKVDDVIKMTLMGTEEESYDEPIVFVFTLEDGQLTTTEWDTALYGEEPLVLTLIDEGNDEAAPPVEADADSEAE